MLFLHSIMIAARAFGLETRSQAAWLIFHDVLQRRLGIPAVQTIVCGMSLGYPDPADTINTFTPDPIETGEICDVGGGLAE
jgi:nitroreductase